MRFNIFTHGFDCRNHHSLSRLSDEMLEDNLRLHPYKKRFLLSNYITSRNAKNNARQNICRRLLIMNNYKYTDNANDIYRNYEYIFFSRLVELSL